MNGLVLSASGAADTVIAVVPKIIKLGGDCLTALTENELTLVFLGVTFVSVGFGVVGKMIHTARCAR